MPPPPPPEGITFTHNPSLTPFSVPPVDFLKTLSTTDGHLYGGIATSALVYRLLPSPSPSPDLEDHILLLQRAATDSLPLLWEPPGGAVDLPHHHTSNDQTDGWGHIPHGYPGDPTLLHALTRELWEEAHLLPHHIAALHTSLRHCPSCLDPFTGDLNLRTADGAGDVFFTKAKKLRIVKYVFECAVDFEKNEVQLDPEEHVRYLWVTRGEIERRVYERAGRGDGEGGKGERIELRFTHETQRSVILEGFRAREEERTRP